MHQDKKGVCVQAQQPGMWPAKASGAIPRHLVHVTSPWWIMLWWAGRNVGSKQALKKDRQVVGQKNLFSIFPIYTISILHASMFLKPCCFAWYPPHCPIMFTGHLRTWCQVNFVMSSGAGFMGSPGQSAWHAYDGGAMGVLVDPQVTLA